MDTKLLRELFEARHGKAWEGTDICEAWMRHNKNCHGCKHEENCENLVKWILSILDGNALKNTLTIHRSTILVTAQTTYHVRRRIIMRISSSDKNAYALARALATIKRTEITCMVNRRGEHSLIPTRNVHPDDKRTIVKIITPNL